MRILKYGFLGEDDAQKIFLKNYLGAFGSTDFSFEFDENFPLKAKDRNSVLKRFTEAIQLGISVYQQDIFFVGIDLDDSEQAKLFSLFEEMKAQINPRFKDQTCIFIPIQCIEHWLWYLKMKKVNPNITKNEIIEKQPRPKAKEIVYGSKRPSNEVSNPIVDSLSKDTDIEWLENRSESFRHFHGQVKLLLFKL